MQAQDHQVAETHPEHPHGEDADRHREGGVAGGAEDVGQGEAGWPDEQRDDIEPDHHLQRHGVGLRGEVEPGQSDAVQEEEGRQVHDPGTGVGHQQEAAGVVFGLLLFACTQALADDGEHRHADRVGRNIQEGGDVARHGVGRNGRGAEGGRQAGDRQFADLEHAVFDAGRDAHPQDAADEGQVGLQIGQVLDAEQAAGLFQQVDDGKAGDHPGDKAGQRGTHDAHLKVEDEHGVAADVHHVHHQTGQHADLAVALCAEESSTGVVHTDEGIAQRREQEIRLGVAHDVGVNGAEDAPQDAVPPHRYHGGDHGAERDHDEQDLGGGGLGVLRFPVADVLAGDDGTAGGKRAEQLDHQDIE